MKIEKDKFFKTRDGRKARIYAVDGKADHAIHGATFDAMMGWVICSWFKWGAWSDVAQEITDLDLVSEWQEPKPRLRAWMHKKSGEVVLLPEGETLLGIKLIPCPWLDQPEEGE